MEEGGWGLVRALLICSEHQDGRVAARQESISIIEVLLNPRDIAMDLRYQNKYKYQYRFCFLRTRRERHSETSFINNARDADNSSPILDDFRPCDWMDHLISYRERNKSDAING